MATFALFNDIKRIIRTQRLETEGVTTIFGDVKLDLTRAPLEPGEHSIRLITVFGDIKLRVPEHIGVEIDSMMVFGELEVETMADGEEEKPGASWVSENYDRASVRVHITIQGVFGDVDIIRVPVPVESAPVMARLITTNVSPEMTPSYEGETSKLRRD